MLLPHRAEHRPRHLPPARRATAPVRLELRPVGPLPRATTRRSSEPPAGAVHPRPSATDRYEIIRAATRPAAAAPDVCTATRPRFTLGRRKAHATRSLYRDRGRAAATTARGDRCGAPGYFRADLAPTAGDPVDAGRLDRAVGDDPGARRRTRPRAPSSSAAQRLAASGRPQRSTGSPPSWCWPPTSSSSRPAGRVEDAARARAAGDEVRTVIAGYHWFTDWGRDTMISLEGPDARHRPARARPATSCARSPTTSATA